ncbi:MAG: histone [Candidatus Aenigmarchaeota archaeon]|nr:histone [Candidatus Aenigmarchaeota archaeon]
MGLPLAPVEKILKKSNMRISDEAVREFALLLEEITADIAAEATSIAKSEGRKTVLVKDILEAKRKIE